jgi:hypothetical protein
MHAENQRAHRGGGKSAFKIMCMMKSPRASTRYCRLKGNNHQKEERIAARRVGKQRQKNSRVSLPCVAI